MTWVYGTMVVIGLLLQVWADLSLPPTAARYPTPIVRRTHRGPYRWRRHPMYDGAIMMMTGLGGLGGGIWNAIAFFTITEVVTREWKWREGG